MAASVSAALFTKALAHTRQAPPTHRKPSTLKTRQPSTPGEAATTYSTSEELSSKQAHAHLPAHQHGKASVLLLRRMHGRKPGRGLERVRTSIVTSVGSTETFAGEGSALARSAWAFFASSAIFWLAMSCFAVFSAFCHPQPPHHARQSHCAPSTRLPHMAPMRRPYRMYC